MTLKNRFLGGIIIMGGMFILIQLSVKNLTIVSYLFLAIFLIVIPSVVRETFRKERKQIPDVATLESMETKDIEFLLREIQCSRLSSKEIKRAQWILSEYINDPLKFDATVILLTVQLLGSSSTSEETKKLLNDTRGKSIGLLKSTCQLFIENNWGKIKDSTTSSPVESSNLIPISSKGTIPRF